MSKFDFTVFYGGNNNQFVAHANKYTKQEAVCLFNDEFDDYACKEATLDDVEQAWVRYYISPPDSCGYDGPCYTFCKPGMRGSFPVWVIDIVRQE